ncbi:sulfatase [Pirellulales bacterium]|nr:sulfatase [Pirellulales bacterium]
MKDRTQDLSAPVGALALARWTLVAWFATALSSTALFSTPLFAVAGASAEPESSDKRPNLVVIFIDDMGYADIGPFGAESYATPNLDRMAAEGRKFTDFLSATAVCSAARAALLTGCYPERVSILGALGPGAKHGLHWDELTLAELCKQAGYATACFGKWHLGHRPEFLPLQHGFDQYYGLPYSNDMWPQHPDVVNLPADAEQRKRGYPPLPMYEGNQIVDDEVTAADQAQLTTDYTGRAVEFIEQHRDEPFFLYVPHSMVHVPLFVSEKFRGKSGAGLFGDVVMEVDWSVGEILGALAKHNLDERTWVVFTSDNGPWLSYGDHAGSAGPLREGKGTMFEGGYREPCVMRWPGKIPAGTVCDELSSTIDLLPTMAHLLGVELPAERPIDGENIWSLIAGESEAVSPHEAFYCYYGRELRAVRDRRWKLHLPHQYRTMQGSEVGSDGVPGPYRHKKIGAALFDLQNDVGETKDVAADHPEIVARLDKVAEQARHDLGDALTKQTGIGVRPHGKSAN